MSCFVVIQLAFLSLERLRPHHRGEIEGGLAYKFYRSTLW